jgi:hypothetical protein
MSKIDENSRRAKFLFIGLLILFAGLMLFIIGGITFNYPLAFIGLAITIPGITITAMHSRALEKILLNK